MFSRDALTGEIGVHGFAALGRLVPEPAIAAVVSALGYVEHEGTLSRRGSPHAIRNLLEAVPEVQVLARSDPVRAVVETVLGPAAFAVRGILFDKTPAANWKVAWHQDLTIAVREPKETPGFGPWSTKAGIPHVQPPVEILQRMLAVRIHLDDCGPANGPLWVIPGSHRSGRLRSGQIARWREAVPQVACTSSRGGVLFMRPLLLHASSPATVPRHRRVVHLEFAAEELPHGLQWHGRW